MSEYDAKVDRELHRRIDWNMTNHAPTGEQVTDRFEALREFAKSFAHAIVDLCPDGRDRDLALTHAEDALMRAVAAIARNQDAMVASLMPQLMEDLIDLPVSRCTCPPGPEEDSIIPSAECPEHRNLLDEPIQGSGPGVEELERQAAEALTPREREKETD